ncbi:MAG: OmpA/MotB family protein [Campylobacterota bacterium]
MAQKKCPECPKCVPGWLVQFGDLMSLLLTFFILLLSMAVMDKKKVEEYFDIMKKSMGFIDKTTSVETQTQKNSTAQSTSQDSQSESSQDSMAQEAAQDMAEIIQEINANSASELQEVSIEKGKNEFTLDIPSTIIFKEGEYELNSPAAKNFVAKIARVIRTMPQTFNIEIIGHTDRSQINSDEIPRDGWDISALRSISVVKELIKNRIDPGVLKVAAYSSYHPKSELASDNRRVEMRFFAQETQDNLLSEESFFDRLE